jgi:thioredoxin 1
MIEVIKFGAEWCGPCKMYEPILENLKEKYDAKTPANVSIMSIDIDENPDMASKYSIRNIPTTLFIKEGNVVLKKVGVIQAPEFEDIIKTL